MNKIKYLIIILILVCMSTGCASWERTKKNWKSDVGDGLYRKVNVYSYDGKLIATYEGKLDLQENEGKVLFDLDGKRYVYYNALVEVIEK